MPISEWDRKYEEKERQLKPLLTDEFLSTLTEAGKTCGWYVDYVEVANFIEWCYGLANKDYPPDLRESYDYDSDNVKSQD